jgi:hypothetical protein
MCNRSIALAFSQDMVWGGAYGQHVERWRSEKSPTVQGVFDDQKKFGLGKGERWEVKKSPQKAPKKPQEKPLTQPCTKPVGIPTQKSKKLFFFGFRIPVFRIFFSVGRLFAAFLVARDHDTSPGFFPRGLTLPRDCYRNNFILAEGSTLKPS